MGISNNDMARGASAGAGRPLVLLLFVQRQLFRDSFEYVEPLGLMSLAAYIDEKGYEPGVFTGTSLAAMELLKKKAAGRGVSAVGFYCDFENVTLVEELARRIRDEYSIPVIAGGPQAFVLGAEFFEASGCVAAARGEGEVTLFELLEFAVGKKGRLEDIEGINFLDGSGRLVSTGEREPVADLDSLPHQKLSHSLTGPKSNIAVLSGRGCPFRCAFCFMGGAAKKVRLRSVENVMAEIRKGLDENPGIRYVWFADDTFTLERERLARFCDELSALRRERDFVWFCEAHPGLLSRWPEMIGRMVDSGLVRMQIGIETGSKRLIGRYGKNTDLDQIESVIEACRKAGLPQLCGNVILGGAFETLETLEETWGFIERNVRRAPGMLDISFTLFTPYPGAAMTERPEEFGLEMTDARSLTSIGDLPVARTEALDAYQISSARREFSAKLAGLMRGLAADGVVPHDLITSHYRLRSDYGISSVWMRWAYSKLPFLDRKYSIMASSSAKRLCDIDPAEAMRWRPLRVFGLWNAIAWRGMVPEISGYVLSPLEYELLLHCSGKMRLGEALEAVYPRFAAAHEGFGDFVSTAMETVSDFDRKNWITMTKY